MSFNVIRNGIVRNSMLCRHDSNEGYSVVWDTNDDFKQYEEFNGLTSRLVWDRNFFCVASSGICYVGPTTDQAPFDGSVYDRVEVTYRIEVGFGQSAPTTGRIQFQTDDDPIYDETKVLDFESSSRNTEGQGEGESGLNGGTWRLY